MSNKNRKHNLTYVLAICSVAALGGLLQGYDTSVISGVIEPLNKHFSLTSSQTGWAVSSIVIGCIIGAYMAGKLADRYGRKMALIITVFFMLVSVAGMAVANDFTTFILFRILGGFGIGLSSVVSPIYMTEVSPKDYRGRVVTMNMICFVGGQVLVLIINYLIAKGSDPAWLTGLGWRYMLGVGIIPCMLFLIFVGFIPESPRWNVMKGRDEAALKTLTQISNARHAENVLQEIKASFHQDAARVEAQANVPVSKFNRNAKMIIFIAAMIAMFNQFTGINVIQYFGPTLLMNVTGNMEEAMYMVTWLAGLQFLGVLLGMMMVDRVGRRILLLVGSCSTFVCLALTFFTFYFGVKGYASIIGLLGFMFIFGMTWAQIAWTVVGEILPNHLRAVGMGIAYAAMWVANFVISQGFPMINDNTWLREYFNGGFPLLLFAVCCLISWWFVHRYIPETKGVALEKVEELVAERIGKDQTVAISTNITH
ncbi:TPA: sugar porter family MFS transporter [Klebsiella pneumoniae]|uniref:sugar porter family MFS transporter n=1 Tax=Klebsiella pneumoniae complex TaxID=3390273 RepID=UPI002847BFFC|nr:sugar porter family MFS transporter [Klebsiella pneumoniae]MDR4634302.1 sugar porter family MFS transporter [Klebsiella pneumoniae]HBQ6640395.1 sugar porter family MFS transporter [Klebsiella pneumoniae]HBY9717246.1 sugar porter family MFS transporter [Klebsiella aerogenes]